MAVRVTRTEVNSTYFVTFTCYKWLNLIQASDTHYAFEKWFLYLESKGVQILGYVVMPNHFHGIFFLSDSCNVSLNTLIGNGKRFIAYEIVRGLRKQDTVLCKALLIRIAKNITKRDSLKGQRHYVFMPSFDSKVLYSKSMVDRKLEYIHMNPVVGKWQLVQHFTDYQYSSAAFYELGSANTLVTNYLSVF